MQRIDGEQGYEQVSLERSLLLAVKQAEERIPQANLPAVHPNTCVNLPFIPVQPNPGDPTREREQV